MLTYAFNSSHRDCSKEIAKSLSCFITAPLPVIVCVGSDLVVGDSLGPYVGTALFENLKGKAFVYGTLDNPVTAREVPFISKNIKLLHPKSTIIIVDAAVGDVKDVGLVKIKNCGIKPGLASNKDLPEIGDVSVLGIIACSNKELYKARFSLVYKLSIDIINGITSAVI